MRFLVSGLLAIAALIGPVKSSPSPQPTPTVPLRVGQVTRHPANFKNKSVHLEGYLLVRKGSYAIFSDESSGAISYYDLPVTGQNLDSLVTKVKYDLQGTFTYGGLRAMNHNPYHLQLTKVPFSVK